MRMFMIPVGGVAVLLMLTVIFGSWFQVDQGERGVKLRNGAVVSIVEPGLGFKTPIFDSVVDMDVRTQKMEFTNLAAYSKDIQTATIHASINYHINPAKVADIYSMYGTGYRDSILVPLVHPAVKNTFGQFTAQEIVSQREKLGADIHSALVDSTASTGLIIDSIQIEGVDFSDAFEKAIEERMQAEVAVAKQRQENERVKVEAEQIKTRADAEAYRVRIEAESIAISIKQQGEALRSSPDYVKKIQAERWDGKLPVYNLGGGDGNFLIDLRK